MKSTAEWATGWRHGVGEGYMTQVEAESCVEAIREEMRGACIEAVENVRGRISQWDAGKAEAMSAFADAIKDLILKIGKPMIKKGILVRRGPHVTFVVDTDAIHGYPPIALGKDEVEWRGDGWYVKEGQR